MGAVGSVAALVLALVFIWSGVAKLRERASVGRDFAAIGVPAPTVSVVVVALVEVAVAATLVVQHRVGAVLALVLLGLFTLVLISVLRSGREIRCGCFGANAREPISMVDVVRNVSLAVIGGLALFGGRSFAIDLPAVMVVSLTALCLLVVVNLIALAQTSGALIRIELAGEAAGGGELP